MVNIGMMNINRLIVKNIYENAIVKKAKERCLNKERVFLIVGVQERKRINNGKWKKHNNR